MKTQYIEVDETEFNRWESQFWGNIISKEDLWNGILKLKIAYFENTLEKNV